MHNMGLIEVEYTRYFLVMHPSFFQTRCQKSEMRSVNKSLLSETDLL